MTFRSLMCHYLEDRKTYKKISIVRTIYFFPVHPLTVLSCVSQSAKCLSGCMCCKCQVSVSVVGL